MCTRLAFVPTSQPMLIDEIGLEPIMCWNVIHFYSPFLVRVVSHNLRYLVRRYQWFALETLSVFARTPLTNLLSRQTVNLLMRQGLVPAIWGCLPFYGLLPLGSSVWFLPQAIPTAL